MVDQLAMLRLFHVPDTVQVGEPMASWGSTPRPIRGFRLPCSCPPTSPPGCRCRPVLRTRARWLPAAPHGAGVRVPPGGYALPMWSGGPD